MTIHECIRTKGILIDCEVIPHRCGEVEIFFENKAEEREDSTIFDVNWPLTRAGEAELTTLYKGFCKDNKIPANTVEAIHLNSVSEF